MLYVGIDVAKNKHDVTVLDETGKMVKRGSSHLRWALIQAAIKVARYSPAFNSL